jgi:hypothetical protein
LSFERKASATWLPQEVREPESTIPPLRHTRTPECQSWALGAYRLDPHGNRTNPNTTHPHPQHTHTLHTHTHTLRAPLLRQTSAQSHSVSTHVGCMICTHVGCMISTHVGCMICLACWCLLLTDMTDRELDRVNIDALIALLEFVMTLDLRRTRSRLPIPHLAHDCPSHISLTTAHPTSRSRLPIPHLDHDCPSRSTFAARADMPALDSCTPVTRRRCRSACLLSSTASSELLVAHAHR